MQLRRVEDGDLVDVTVTTCDRHRPLVAGRHVAPHLTGCGLQLDRGLCLERHPRPPAEQRGDRVEQPADGGRRRA